MSPVQEVAAVRALSRALRRRLHPPSRVAELVAVPHLDATRGRARVMRECRDLLARFGYSLDAVIDGWTGDALTGTAAAERLQTDEHRAERDDYWWSGDVCWSRPDGASVVAPEHTEWRTLRLVAWGADAETVLQALDAAVGH